MREVNLFHASSVYEFKECHVASCVLMLAHHGATTSTACHGATETRAGSSLLAYKLPCQRVLAI